MAGESWYAIFKTKDGTLVSTGTEIADANTLEKNGLEAIVIPGNPSLNRWEWDMEKCTFVDKVVEHEHSSVVSLVMQQQEIAALDDATKAKIETAITNVVGAGI